MPTFPVDDLEPRRVPARLPTARPGRMTAMLKLAPPVEPILAKSSAGIPRSGGIVFEPQWDGFRCIVFRHGDDLVLQSRSGKTLERYFPEAVTMLRDALPERCVVDGELVVALPHESGARLSFDALAERVHPAESRITMLAEQHPSSF